MNERGYVLLEMLVSLPVLLFLMSVLGASVLWSFKVLSWQKDDWELQQELLYVMERIAEDANRAEYAKIEHGPQGDQLSLRYRRGVSGAALEGKPREVVLYGKQESERYGEGRIFVRNISMPMTGDSLLGRVNITEFRCSMETPHTLRIRLTGKSFLTKHEFSLETAVFMKGQG